MLRLFFHHTLLLSGAGVQGRLTANSSAKSEKAKDIIGARCQLVGITQCSYRSEGGFRLKLDTDCIAGLSDDAYAFTIHAI
jgi:hypothetical protein